MNEIIAKYNLELTDMPGDYPVYFKRDWGFFLEFRPNAVIIFDDNRLIHTSEYVLNEFTCNDIKRFLTL